MPARYASTRLPAKPLADICGLPMIVHTMKRAMMCEDLDDVIVATDDKRIFDVVEKYGGKAMMTDENHIDGIFRMQEVSTKGEGDIYISINGDEPLLDFKDITKSLNGLIENDEVLYTSRSDISSDARVEKQAMWKGYYLVSFSKRILDKFVYEMESSELNERKSLNENKLLEYGYKIKAIRTDTNALSVDTKEDLEIVREMMKNDKLFESYKDCKILYK
ncbi:cytidylyltransferase domain-containing protein [Arcobacter vandammei]|uniref:cytidylyltransferase domain-containing protein n=1 Tax=Arcobacter vandammei TaxID=2782243 RepID=UPI00211D3736